MAAKGELSPADFDAAVWQRVRAVAPRAVRCRIVFEAEDEDDEIVRGSFPVFPPAEASGGPLRLTKTERRIVGVFADHDPGHKIKGVTIASLIGIDPSTIRKHLSALVAKKVLDNNPPDPGYFRGIRFAEAEAL